MDTLQRKQLALELVGGDSDLGRVLKLPDEPVRAGEIRTQSLSVSI